MNRYMNRYKFEVTNIIVNMLDEYNLVEDVYYQEWSAFNPEMECIKVNTNTLADTPLFKKEIYFGCYDNTDRISCMQRILPYIYSERVRGELLRDIQEQKQQDDTFGIIFIDGMMLADAIYSSPTDINHLILCMKDIGEVAEIATKRMEPYVHRRRADEENRLRWI